LHIEGLNILLRIFKSTYINVIKVEIYLFGSLFIIFYDHYFNLSNNI